MPLLVERLGVCIGLPVNASGFSFEVNWKAVPLVGGLLLGSAGLVTVSLYASTLTRNLLHALGLSVVLCVFAFSIIALFAVIEPVSFIMLPLWRGPLIGIIGWPVMTGTVFVLSYHNFKQLAIGGKSWSRNLATLLYALVSVSVITTLVYHRVWELWMPDEPIQSTYGRLILPAYVGTRGRYPAPAKLEASSNRIAVIRDGRVWERLRNAYFLKAHPHYLLEASRMLDSWQQGFIGGDDWRDVAVSDQNAYAIRKDGSLWDISDVRPGSDRDRSGPKRFGEASDWKSIYSGGEHFLALKTDGTIWQWGEKWIGSGKSFSREKIPTPVQVGTAADWVAVCDSWAASAALKSDGSVWRFGMVYTINTNGLGDRRIVGQPEPWLKWSSQQGTLASLDLSPEGASLVAVDGDGSLWIGGYVPDGLLEPKEKALATDEMVILGADPKWTTAMWKGFGGLVTIGRSGELAKWSMMPNFIRDGHAFVQRKVLSQYLDWEAACGFRDSILSLAADGSLCEWASPNDQWRNVPNGPDPSLLLMPSRVKATRVAQIKW